MRNVNQWIREAVDAAGDTPVCALIFTKDAADNWANKYNSPVSPEEWEQVVKMMYESSITDSLDDLFQIIVDEVVEHD